MTVEQNADYTAWAGARWGPLVRSAVFLGCSAEDAQDLAQTTLVRCYAQWSKVCRADDRDAYVFRVLLNCLRDSRRRRWWGEHPTEVLPEPASRAGTDETDAVDVADAVHRALANLTDAHREVVVLRYFVHLDEQQTARVLGIAPGTVKSRLARALAQLALDPHLTDLPTGALP